MNLDTWLAKIFQSSVPLRRLNEDHLPTAIASGCLIDYSNKRLLLTVSHATGDQKNWAIEIRYEKGKGTISYQLGAMFFLTNIDFKSGDIKNIDFSYVEVPKDLIAYRQDLDMAGNILNQVPICVFRPDFNITPDVQDKFGFAGSVKPSIEDHHGQTYVFAELIIYSDLTFARKDNEFYVFKLPMKHPGHDNFRGCSGAPVIDTKGRLLGLVSHGCVETDEIYAISISKYKIALDILVGNL